MSESVDWPHMLAVCRSIDGTYFISNTLFRTEAHARHELGDCFVQMAHELRAIPLLINEERLLAKMKELK